MSKPSCRNVENSRERALSRRAARRVWRRFSLFTLLHANNNMSQLDNDIIRREIAELRTKVKSLGRKYAESMTVGQMTLSKHTPTATGKSYTDDRTLEINALHQENLHRMVGITSFQVADLNGFGIRFESFDGHTFKAPHYIILKYNRKGQLSLYRHTIPAYIPLKAYSKHLNTDLRYFSKLVRRDLMAVEGRRKSIAVRSHGIRRITADEAVRLIKVQLSDDRTYHMLCDKQNISKIYSDRSIDKRTEELLLGPLDSLGDRISMLESI